MIDSKPERSLFAKTAGGVFWTGLGTGGQTLIQFVVLIVLARLLTPEDFGIVAAAMVVVGLSTIFSLLGVGPAIVQRPNLDLRHIQTGFAISVAFGFIFYAIVWIVAPTIENFFRMDGLSEVLRLISLVFPIKGLSTISQSLAQRWLRFKFLSVCTVISFAIGYGPIGIVLAAIGFGPFALVWAAVGQATVMTVLLLIGQKHSFAPKISNKAIQELMYFGSGFTVARLGNYVANQGDNAIVGRLLNATSLGVYGRAYQLMMVPANLIGTVLDKVLFPSLASIQHEKERLSLAYRRGVSTVALFMIPMSVFMIVFAEELVSIILGNQWGEVILPLQILSAGLVFRTGYKISESSARATGAVYRQAWRQWAYAMAVVTFAAIGSTQGLPGVALGVTFAIVLNYILMANLSCRITGLSWYAFAGAHFQGFALGSACLILIITFNYAVSPKLDTFATLGLAGTLVCIFVIILWRCFPTVFLGRDGSWLLNRLKNLLTIYKTKI